MEGNQSEIPQRPERWTRLGTNDASDYLIVALFCCCYKDACSWVNFLSWLVIEYALLISCWLEMSEGHEDKFYTYEL